MSSVIHTDYAKLAYRVVLVFSFRQLMKIGLQRCDVLGEVAWVVPSHFFAIPLWSYPAYTTMTRICWVSVGMVALLTDTL
jgi:hypothetical protein